MPNINLIRRRKAPSAPQPVNPAIGEVWLDHDNTRQMFVWNGDTWVNVNADGTIETDDFDQSEAYDRAMSIL